MISFYALNKDLAEHYQYPLLPLNSTLSVNITGADASFTRSVSMAIVWTRWTNVDIIQGKVIRVSTWLPPT